MKRKLASTTSTSCCAPDGSEKNKQKQRMVNDEIHINGIPPKSKKELRLERKAAKKKLAERSVAQDDPGNKRLDKEEYQKLKKQRRAEKRKEEEKLRRKELREEKKLRKRKKINRELNAKGGHNGVSILKKQRKSQVQNDREDESSMAKEERQTNIDAFRSVFHGVNASTSSESGMTLTRLGVQYEDKIVGTGKVVKEGMQITVKYILTGGKFGAVLDSSKKFTFRPGMGEVIRGWDIGLEGMREGGRRKLIIPPKAGYGGKDIGAGPGALLYFDVTLLKCGER